MSKEIVIFVVPSDEKDRKALADALSQGYRVLSVTAGQVATTQALGYDCQAEAYHGCFCFVLERP